MDDYVDLVETQLGELIERGAHRRRRLTGVHVPRLPRGTPALAGSTALAMAVAALVLLNARDRQPPQHVSSGVSAGEIDLSFVRILRRPVTSADRPPAGTRGLRVHLLWEMTC